MRLKQHRRVAGDRSRISLALLNLTDWVRTRPWLRVLYCRLPGLWRSWLYDVMRGVASSRLRFLRTRAWSRPLPATPVVVAPVCSELPGVNILGYLRGDFGLAEGARAYARALLASGTPVALVDIALDIPHSMGDQSLEAYIGNTLRYPVSLVFVNPDYLEAALAQIGCTRCDGHYVIACWFWELPMIPRAWLPALALVDEILVSSRFIEEAMRKITDKPVMHVPLPLGEIFDSGLQRADFGLDDSFTFLTTFDFNSWIARKNPYAVLRAFAAAFPLDRSDVCLLVKTSNGHRHPEALRNLLLHAAADPRVIVRDEVIDRAHLNALLRCCDAYVSLHRAEGFGLGLAECMSMGKPVIATGWSGNLEFMSADNAMLVDVRLVPVCDGEYPHELGDVWAEPNIDTAANAMRSLVDDPGHAKALGRKAAASIRDSLSLQRASAAINVRLRELVGCAAHLSSIDAGFPCHH